ncbi:MAG: dihydrodipicolinate reductase [Armatimonadetes bacterium]|nr:dihydrodipicolinate reductase [Armatimonadota bacterium]
MDKHKTLHVGLGPIGCEIVSAAIKSGTCEPVAAVDINPELAGKSLADVVAMEGVPPVEIMSDLAEAAEAAVERGATVALVATGSRVEQVQPQFETLMAAGLNCVTTCEEMIFPWLRAATAADELDTAAREAGVSLLGAGVNPGFVLDLLPFVTTRVCQTVRAVYATRIVNASLRRRQLQEKIGSGLEPDEFRARAAENAIGHVGLAESAALLADSLGWPWDDIEQSIEPVIADVDVKTDYFDVKQGRVRGQAQKLRLTAPQGVIELELTMALDEPSLDAVRIEGEPPVNLLVEGGIHGDVATAGTVINFAGPCVKAAPGLRTVTDVPLS